MFLFSACAVKEPPLPATLLNRDVAHEMKKGNAYWIEVQIPQRKLVLAKGDHIIKTFSVAVGMPDYPTPVGPRSIHSVIWNPWWTPPQGSDWVKDPTPIKPRTPENPLGEIKMPLGNLYLIHGTRAVYSIGQWASHGCVRMLFEDIFSLVQLIMTTHSDMSAIEAMERANRHPDEEFMTKLLKEVPVVLSYDTVKVHEGYVTIYPDFYNRNGNATEQVAYVLEPYAKEKRINRKKIQSYLKTFKGHLIHQPVETFLE